MAKFCFKAAIGFFSILLLCGSCKPESTSEISNLTEYLIESNGKNEILLLNDSLTVSEVKDILCLDTCFCGNSLRTRGFALNLELNVKAFELEDRIIVPFNSYQCSSIVGHIQSSRPFNIDLGNISISVEHQISEYINLALEESRPLIFDILLQDEQEIYDSRIGIELILKSYLQKVNDISEFLNKKPVNELSESELLPIKQMCPISFRLITSIESADCSNYFEKIGQDL